MIHSSALSKKLSAWAKMHLNFMRKCIISMPCPLKHQSLEPLSLQGSTLEEIILGLF